MNILIAIPGMRSFADFLGKSKRVGFAPATGFLLARAAAFFLVLAAAPASAGVLYPVPAMQITLQDRDTGESIHGAIADVQWVKETYTPIHPQSTMLDEAYVSADANGVIRVSGKEYVLVASHFHYLTMTVRQPLHETLTLTWMGKELDTIREGKVTEGVKKFMETTIARWEYRNGTMTVTVLPQAIDAKYRHSPTVQQGNGLLVGEFSETEIYFRQAKMLGLSVDTRGVFQLWKALADRFPSYWPTIRDREKRIEDILAGRVEPL